jgi:hypothetical protein
VAAEDIEVTEAKVTYTTKELLRRIDDRFERLEGLVTNVPTRTEFDHLDGRVGRLEAEGLKMTAATSAVAQAQAVSDKRGEKRWTRGEKIVGIVFVAFTTALNILALAPDLIR